MALFHICLSLGLWINGSYYATASCVTENNNNNSNIYFALGQLKKKVAFAVILFTTCHGATLKKKSTNNFKRAVETYSYPVPTETLEENPENVKGKVIVETIKSISPSEYQDSTGLVGSNIEESTASGKLPAGTVTFNAFEPDTTNKEENLVSTETSAPAKKKTNYKYYTGSIGSNSQKPISTAAQTSSTNSPSSIRTTSVESITTLFPGYQYNSHSNFPQSVSGETLASEKPLKIITTRGKPGNGRYTLQKITKKSSKIESKLSDSKPEETGFNGYQFDGLGSLSFESKHSGSQGGGGMMGASYMRSSSPFYNYHVMLD